MVGKGLVAALILAAWISVPGGIALAQMEDRQQQGLPDPIPPALPPKQVPEDAAEYERLIQENDEIPWEIPDDLLASLEQAARVYQAVMQSFTCNETVRRADYDGGGEVSKERLSTYSYLLVADPLNENLRESRHEFNKKGEPKHDEVIDAEPFPPAYEWVFLFSSYHQPYFSYRHVGQHFDGFDVVHEIEFKGALSFSNGRDIRQWEGRVLVDAFTFTPLEIHAEPNGQDDRIAAMFDQYNRSFSMLGMRTGKRPLGYQAQVQFGFRKELDGPGTIRLTFPTELRYDTQKAVSPQQIVPVKASTRSYANYRFYTTDFSDEVVGELVSND